MTVKRSSTGFEGDSRIGLEMAQQQPGQAAAQLLDLALAGLARLAEAEQHHPARRELGRRQDFQEITRLSLELARGERAADGTPGAALDFGSALGQRAAFMHAHDQRALLVEVKLGKPYFHSVNPRRIL
jgi:hypothetical protein